MLIFLCMSIKFILEKGKKERNLISKLFIIA